MPHHQTIEHIVLLKVKEGTDESKIQAMEERLTNLKNMDGVNVLHLESGPVHRIQTSSESNLTFTHFLHSRYEEKEHLDTYMAHPQHLELVRDYTDPLTDDYMIVDWVVVHDEPLVDHPAPGSAMRVVFWKLKEGVGETGKGKVLEAVREEGGKGKDLVQFTCGENYCGAAKGYEIAALVVFKGVKELDKGGQEFVKKVEEKAKEFVESVFVVDYIV